MVNNIENIKKLLKFEKEGDFYFLQIFKRRKDNPDLELSVKRIKSYSIYSLEEYEEVVEKAKIICERENARLYIRLNQQNSYDVSLRLIEEISTNIRKNNMRRNERDLWNSIAGQGGKKQYHMLDIDKEHLDNYPNLIWVVSDTLKRHFLEIRNQNLDIIVNNTKSGKHILVPPFDNRILNNINNYFRSKGLPIIQIQKDANTLIYSK